MRTTNKIIAASIAGLTSLAAHADSGRCSEATLNTVRNYFSLSTGGEIRASVCMLTTGKRKEELAAVAYAPAGYSFAETESPLPLYVAVISTSTHNVVAAHVDGVFEDAAFQVSAEEIRWGEKTYLLSKNVQAFSLLVDGFKTAGSWDGEIGPELTLLAYNGKTIRPVLRGLSTFQATCHAVTCKMPSHDRLVKKVTLRLSKNETNGFKDFILTTKRFDGRIIRYKAQYDGLSYSLGGWLSQWNE